ncbi:MULTISPECIES: MATE family efflux transporter [Glaesserella]|uniref:Multidrug-efflux transporter n=1 Tax=Glaesserella australis TaxID=2094024 RepID=A0A328C1Z8_9PAST|nr:MULTISPECIES: MATE family efflux transporter [Glaesserella]AUI66300.1 MATE family efflux transporter [Glaesserella sp. 15-184]RAL19322.1 MATE family efflux transporter [Glaesserella australis]
MNFQWQHYPENTKKLFRLSTPIFVSQLATSGMGLADIIMAGLVSDADVSAIAVSHSIYFPLFLLVLGVLNAITPTVSYLNGAGQRSLIAHQVRQGVWIVLMLSIPLIFIYLNAHLIFTLMDTPAEFAEKAQQYLIALCFGLIPALLAVNLRCFNDGLSNPKPAMYITFFGLILNIPLNYIFIFGKLGMPELGAVGCGVATAIVNWVMFGLILHYCYTNSSQKDIRLFEKWIEAPCKATLAKLFKLGMPIGFALFTEVMLFAASSLIISPLGSQMVASHQVALQTSSLFFMIPLSFSIATTILVGQTLGEKRIEETKYLTYHAIFTCSIVAVGMALIILLLKDFIPYAFTSDPTSIAIASGLLIFAAIYQIPDSIQAVCNGILRGYKNTKPILLTTLICYWLVGMPLGTILARTDWLGKPMAAAGFWLTFCICLSLAAGLFFYYMRKIQSMPEQALIQRLETMK